VELAGVGVAKSRGAHRHPARFPVIARCPLRHVGHRPVLRHATITASTPADRMEELMNRAQLIDAVAAATGLPRAQVEATLSATLPGAGCCGVRGQGSAPRLRHL